MSKSSSRQEVLRRSRHCQIVRHRKICPLGPHLSLSGGFVFLSRNYIQTQMRHLSPKARLRVYDPVLLIFLSPPLGVICYPIPLISPSPPLRACNPGWARLLVKFSDVTRALVPYHIFASHGKILVTPLAVARTSWAL